MAKVKIFTAQVDYQAQLNSEISIFLDKLENEGHAFISLNTLVYGRHPGSMDNLRTEIVYQENYTRKPITEKTKC